MTNIQLTNEQKEAGLDMVRRRMENTGETWEEARDHICAFLRDYATQLDTRD